MNGRAHDREHGGHGRGHENDHDARDHPLPEYRRD